MDVIDVRSVTPAFVFHIRSDACLLQNGSHLRALGSHYAKKGDLIYPLLKSRYGISGPSEVNGVDMADKIFER